MTMTELPRSIISTSLIGASTSPVIHGEGRECPNCGSQLSDDLNYCCADANSKWGPSCMDFQDPPQIIGSR